VASPIHALVAGEADQLERLLSTIGALLGPVREGVNVKVVSEMLGHASITITLNIYAHVLPDMQDSAANAMEAALGGVL
jgi:integrase